MPLSNDRIRLDQNERRDLLLMGFNHVVYIDKDVSVEVVGSVQSAFRKERDAEAEAARLSSLYEHVEKDAFAVASI
jgi:citrate synthase